jgi:nucleosome binding factor SPN SPT16 subunit
LTHRPYLEELLEKMEVPTDYNGPKLEIVLRTARPVDNTDEVIASVLGNVKAGGKVAIFQKDQADGELTEKTLKGIE